MLVVDAEVRLTLVLRTVAAGTAATIK